MIMKLDWLFALHEADTCTRTMQHTEMCDCNHEGLSRVSQSTSQGDLDPTASLDFICSMLLLRLPLVIMICSRLRLCMILPTRDGDEDLFE
jgi:hypothetical protein